MPLRRRLSGLVGQAWRFGVVGAGGLLVNLVVFNALLLSVLSAQRVESGPIWATIIATVCAISFNWVGNRLWTFGAYRQSNVVVEGFEFFAVSVFGMLVPLACVWVSHYVLGFTSLLADNIANNVVGLALGSLLRFGAYRWWVFAPHRSLAAKNTGARDEPGHTNATTVTVAGKPPTNPAATIPSSTPDNAAG